MLFYKTTLIFALLLTMPLHAKTLTQQMPKDFVKLADIDPSMIQSQRYASSENFLGRPIPGYRHQGFCATKALAEALKQVNTAAKKLGYQLVIYDTYRPQRAVYAFVAWVGDEADQSTKAYYYPSISKSQIILDGYVAEKSSHSRGSTVDLTLIPLNQALKPLTIYQRTLNNGKTIPYLDDNTVDMGSSFDLFDPISHHDSPYITREQTKMRQQLRSLMHAHGFDELHEEWWHYTLRHEPYPDTYFDFICE